MSILNFFLTSPIVDVISYGWSIEQQMTAHEFSLKKNHNYKITVSLGFLESIAGNDMIKEKFTENGFSNVHVIHGESTNLKRILTATWNQNDTSFHDLHIANVEEIL